MTTVAQVKEAAQPLLQRNPDVALVGRLLVIKPVHHILRCVHVDRSLDPLSFVPTSSVRLLPELKKGFGYIWGGRVRGKTGLWKTTDPDLPEAMCEAIEREALVPMRSIETIDDFINFASKERFPNKHLELYPGTKLIADIARGDLVAAEATCKFLNTKEGKAEYFFMQEKYDRLTQEFCPLVTTKDRTGLAKLLHSYEAQSVKNLKLEKYWEPTPFPIELSS